MAILEESVWKLVESVWKIEHVTTLMERVLMAVMEDLKEIYAKQVTSLRLKSIKVKNDTRFYIKKNLFFLCNTCQ